MKPEFIQNWLSDSRTLRKDRNEITWTRLPWKPYNILSIYL